MRSICSRQGATGRREGMRVLTSSGAANGIIVMIGFGLVKMIIREYR